MRSVWQGTMLVIPLNNFKINKMMKIRVKEIRFKRKD
jgi:hypothetical protein